MSAPRNAEEYCERHDDLFKLERVGDQLIAHTPCPACLAPDFWVFPVAELADKSLTPTTCGNCKRSFKVILNSDYTIDLIQTGGDDVPAFIDIKRAN